MKRNTGVAFVLLCLAFTLACAHASTPSLIVPRAYQTNEGGSASSVLYHPIRLQNVYSSRMFPSNKVLVIRELRYRPSAGWGDAFSATISDLQINLSTTAAAVDGLSATFANNVGSNDTVVFNGSIDLSSAFCGPKNGPKDFDIIIPLTTPFRYNPARGNLLIDYRNRSGSEASLIDTGVGNGASRVFALGADSTVAESVDQGGEVVQLVYTEWEPEPPPPPPGNGFVIPPAYRTTEGVGGSGVLRHEVRLQNVYASRLFPSNKVLVIRELRYRPSAIHGGAFSTTISNLQINLSTTHAQVDGLSATFANNVGANDTVVFNGSIRLSSAFSGPANGPKAFDIIIPLSTPFRYNPAQGNLLIDYRNRSDSGVTWIDSGVGNGASRVISLGVNATVAQTVDQGAEVVQLVYTEGEPEPPPPGNGFVIPPAYRTTEGVGGSSLLRDALRLQNVYASGLFPSNKVLVIRELRYRPSAIHGSGFSATTIADLQINLSTTRAGVDGLSATFANNVGSNDTVVFNGSIRLSSAFSGPAGGPKAFDIIIPLTTPFRYDPSKGNLLIDYRNRSGSGVTLIDSGVGNGASRVFALGASSTTAQAVDQGAEVVQLVYTEGEPEPPPPPPGNGFVIPPAYRTTEGVGGSGVLRHEVRLQNVYASRLFPSNKVLVIRELRYRPSAIHGGAFSATISNLQINLSTTHAQVDGLSATFANNVGANDTVVFNGSIRLSSAFSGPANGPKAFDIIIPLSTPFRYNPAQGNLLIDYRNRSDSGVTWIDSGVGNGASRVISLGVNATVAQTVDQGAEVVQLVYTEGEPEPPPPGGGLIIPPVYATVDSGGGSSVLHHELRLQNVYASRLFPSNKVLVIRELRYRPSAVWGNAFSTTISNLQINLSTTRAGVDGLSATFANNVGSNDTVVFNGSIRLSSAFAGPVNGPKAFDIIIPLTTPFRYNPAQGNLLIDYRNRSGSAAANIDAGVGNGASRVFALGVNSTVAQAVDQGAEVVQLVYTEGEQPPPPPAADYDLSRDFAIEAGNPNGVWSYGWQGTLGGPFNLFTHSKYNFDPAGNPVEVWDKPNSAPAVQHNNGTNTVVTDGGQGNYPPETTWFYPGIQGEPENFGVLRFTVPSGGGGTYNLVTRVRPAYGASLQGDTDFHVLRNGVELFGRALNGSDTAGYTNSLALAAGETVDFVIGRGADNSFFWSGLKIEARLSRTGTNNQVAPVIVSQPSSQTVLVGSTASFTVGAVGSAPLNYQWHKGATPILGARQATLTLTNVQLASAGEYSVVVSNSFGAVTSQAATLTVNTAAGYDLSRDFAIEAGNPNGVWSYGWQGTLGGPFNLFTHSKYNYDPAGAPVEVWDKPDSVPAVMHNNGTTTVITDGGQGNFPPETTWFYPGIEGEPENFGVIRFTVPSGGGGTYNLATRVRPAYAPSLQLDTDFHVLRNGVELFGRALNVSDTAGYTNSLALAAGDTIDFVIGRGADNSFYWSGLKIEARLSRTGTNNTVLPPVIASFTPRSGPTGTVVTILGGNFHPTVGGNRVYFGAAQARVLSASTDMLTVQVPVGATYEPISVNTGNRVAFSHLPFVVTFASSRTIHSGSFTGFNLPAGDLPMTVSIADMEGNGKLDLVAMNYQGSTVGVYLNNSTNFTLRPEHFETPRIYPTAPLPYHMVLADIDGAGGADIVTANRGNNTISIFRNMPAGVFALAPEVSFPVGQDPVGLATGDLDKDGRVDMVVANYESDSITILRQNGNPGTNGPSFDVLELPVGDGPHNVVVADIDGDSRPDIAVANYDANTMSVFRNLTTGAGIGPGSFAPEVTFAPGGNCIAFGDLDGDGRGDLAIAEWHSQVLALYRNVSSPGTIALSEPATFAVGNYPYTIAMSDLDGDARVDLSIVGQMPSFMCVFKNQATPGGLNTNSFAPRVDFPSGWNAVGLSAGDLNGDGRPDLVFANAYDDNLTVYVNQINGGDTNQPPPAADHDLSRDFRIDAGNPNGVWSYGWQGTLGGPFNLFTFSKTYSNPGGPPMEFWEKPWSVPSVIHNNSTNTVVVDNGQGVFPPETTVFYPGVEGEPENFGVIRFTVPSGGGGTYNLVTSVRPAYAPSLQLDTDFHVLKNGVELFGRALSVSDTAGYTNSLALAAGDTIDFVIGRGADNSFYWSGLKISATLKLIRTTATAHRISLAPVSGGRFTFGLAPASSGSYIVETSTDLVNWTALTDEVSGAGSVEIIEPRPSTRQRFYRARLTP